MRFKVDENIPRAVVDLLVEEGHDVEEFARCNVVIEPGSVRVRRPTP